MEFTNDMFIRIVALVEFDISLSLVALICLKLYMPQYMIWNIQRGPLVFGNRPSAPSSVTTLQWCWSSIMIRRFHLSRPFDSHPPQIFPFSGSIKLIRIIPENTLIKLWQWSNPSKSMDSTIVSQYLSCRLVSKYLGQQRLRYEDLLLRRNCEWYEVAELQSPSQLTPWKWSVCSPRPFQTIIPRNGMHCRTLDGRTGKRRWDRHFNKNDKGYDIMQ